jgi:hypothetical protein
VRRRRARALDPRRPAPLPPGPVNLHVILRDTNGSPLGEGWLRQTRIARGWRYDVRIDDPYHPVLFHRVTIEVGS